MAQALLAKRIGKVMSGVKGPDGAEARITRSVLMKEMFPEKPGMELIFDFYTNEQGQPAVRVQYKTGGKVRGSGQWALSAIDNLDVRGLGGFREFANKTGLKPFQLANNVRNLKDWKSSV